jgi:hypothetical protein
MKEEFIDYVFSFYGPGEIFGDKFNHQLTREQVGIGVAILNQHCYENGIEFMGDSYDREFTLSIMLFWYVYKDSLCDIFAFLRENYCITDED